MVDMMEDHLKAAADAAEMTNDALLQRAVHLKEGKRLTCMEQAVIDEIRFRKLKVDRMIG